MKKFLICAAFLSLVFSNNSFSQDLKLMSPVKLKNPENENLGFKTPVPTFNSRAVTPSKKILPPKPVRELPVAKEEPVIEVKESVDTSSSRTDKNINDAKELLRAAERLANSIQDEKALMEKDDFNIAPSTEINEIVNVVVKFDKNQEDVSSTDVKKVEDAIASRVNNPDTYFKIISYYDNPESRNIAFSRLLNTRKILLDKGIKTSQTMIMVLEDDTKQKSNSIEIIFN